MPSLADLRVEDVVSAVSEYRSGARPATVMDRLAKGFSDEEIRAIAAWIAAQGRNTKP